jgi:hypothetical protein
LNAQTGGREPNQPPPDVVDETVEGRVIENQWKEPTEPKLVSLSGDEIKPSDGLPPRIPTTWKSSKHEDEL